MRTINKQWIFCDINFVAYLNHFHCEMNINMGSIIHGRDH